MPAIINSAPDCISTDPGTEALRVEDSADFILQNNFQECTGFMTFGPGSTYGPEGVGAESAYIGLTVIGILFTLFVLAAWTLYENRRLDTYAKARVSGGTPQTAADAAQESELA